MLDTFAAAAPRSLARFIEDVRAIAPVVERPRRFEWLPDGRTALVFRAFEGGHEGDVAILGPRTRALYKSPTGLSRVVLLRFKPGWSAALFGVAASALADRVVPLEALWGRPGRDLGLELLEARTLAEVLDRITRAVVGQSGQTPESSSARLARRAASLIEGGTGRVEDLAGQLGVTARHLRRVFADTIGVGPKDFARGVRLARAVRMAGLSRDWARIAAEAGYYDQSHLIADFRELTGDTPRALLKRSAERA